MSLSRRFSKYSLALLAIALTTILVLNRALAQKMRWITMHSMTSHNTKLP